jgi:hypothetical protein
MLARDERPAPGGAPAKRVDYVFIMGRNMNGTPRNDAFYGSARKHFIDMKAIPGAIVAEAASLEEIVDRVAGGPGPVGNIYIVVHATPIGVEFGLNKGDSGEYGKRIWLDKLQPASAAFGARIAPKLDDRSAIRIRGCNVGRNQKFVKELHKALGGKGTLETPTHRTSYDWETTGRRVTSSRERVTDFALIFNDRREHLRYTPSDLAPLFADKYRTSGISEEMWLRILTKVRPRAVRKSYEWKVDLEDSKSLTEDEIVGVMKGNINEPGEFDYTLDRRSAALAVVTATQLRYEVPLKEIEAATGAERPLPTASDKDYGTFMTNDVVAAPKPAAATSVLVDVHVVKTEDWTGADEVYVRLVGPDGKAEKTKVRSLNDGHRFTFALSAARLGSDLDKPVTIEVYDEDWPDADDLIVRMAWKPSGPPGRNTKSYDGADYRVTARLG